MNRRKFTQAEFLLMIRQIFNEEIITNQILFKDYDNNKCINCIKSFKNRVDSELGLSFSVVYHKYNIGNNNECIIYKKEYDREGFLIEKKIAQINYTYGIYGGCSIWLTDLATNTVTDRLSYAR